MKIKHRDQRTLYSLQLKWKIFIFLNKLSCFIKFKMR